MSSLKFMAPAFICGLLFGIGCTVLFIYSESTYVRLNWSPLPSIRHLQEASHRTVVTTANDYVGVKTSSSVTASSLPVNRDRVDNITASQLYDKVRVLCWIMTSPATLQKKAIHVRDTWSKRCNIRLFMSSVEDKDFPAVGLPVKEGRDQLYEKTKAAYRYAWEHYKDKADWFMKADDDTYVIVENMRFLLKDYDPKKPIFFGRKFKPFMKQGYMSGGAGYVLSKEALKMYIEGLDSNRCKKGGGVEDVEIGRCMSVIGVEAGDSRDAQQRETFHPLSPRHHLIPGSLTSDFWLWKYNYYPMCLGANCSSNYPITFHYVSTQDMHIYDYIIYNVQIYGVSHIYQRYDRLRWEE